MTESPIYCVDTSAAIDAWYEWYPPKNFVNLWKNIEVMIDLGRLISPEECRHELEERGDTLHQWAKLQPKLFVAPDSTQISAVGAITSRFQDWVYHHRNAAFWADPFVIALAQTRGAVVVSSERGGKPTRPKIPWICEQLDVFHRGFTDVITAEDWRF